MTDHIHAPHVSVSEHMAILRERLRRQGASTFRALVSDCAATIEVVARFLGLLELYKQGLVAFDQAAALAELRVRWIADPDGPNEAETDADEEYQ
jgi:segregation and condensation protein A